MYRFTLTVLCTAGIVLAGCDATPAAPAADPEPVEPAGIRELMGDASAEPSGNFRTRATIAGRFQVTDANGRRGRADVRLEGEAADGTPIRGIGTMRFQVLSRRGDDLVVRARIEFSGVAEEPEGDMGFRARWTGRLMGTTSAEPNGAVFDFGPATGRLMGTASAEPSGAFQTHAEITGTASDIQRRGSRGRARVRIAGTMANGTAFDGEGRLRFRVVSRDGDRVVMDARIEFDGTADTGGGAVDLEAQWTGRLVGTASAEPSGNVFELGPSIGQLMGTASAEPSGA